MNIEQILKFTKNEFIYGGHIFAIGAISIVIACAIILDNAFSIDFLIVVYLIFYTIYLYDHSQGASEDFLTNLKRAKYLENKSKISIIITSCVLISEIILFYFGNFHSVIFGSVILIVGFNYGNYFKDVTKKIIGFKNFFVSLVWSLLIVFFIFYYSLEFTFLALLVSIFVFLKIFSIQILFDIRDISSDRKRKLLTIPIVFGKYMSINLVKLINILIISLIFYGLYLNIFYPFIIAITLSVFYSFYYTDKIKNSDNNDLRYFIFAAIEPVFWLFLIFFGKFLLW